MNLMRSAMPCVPLEDLAPMPIKVSRLPPEGGLSSGNGLFYSVGVVGGTGLEKPVFLLRFGRIDDASGE